MPKGNPISKEEFVDIDKEFQSLLQKVKPKCNAEDIENITTAYKLVLEAHKFQRRKSGEPYVFHPIEVARICYEELGLGATSVVAALLHDIVEDTDTTLEEIDQIFGPKIQRIVDGLTKLDGTYNIENKQAENTFV